jgi:hypothetical protein
MMFLTALGSDVEIRLGAPNTASSSIGRIFVEAA